MAYMDFAEPGADLELLYRCPPAMPLAQQPQSFEEHQWALIALARTDTLSSLHPETRLGRLLRTIFGIKRSTPMANPQLEVLRRIAVLSWRHGYNIASSEITDFLCAGFSIHQYEALLVHIGAQRAATGRRTRR